MNSSIFKKKLDKALTYIILTIIAVMSIYPISWIISASFSKESSLYKTSLIPKQFSLDNYIEIITWDKFGRAYINTFIIAVVVMLLSILLNTSAAYILSKYRFKGRNLSLMTMLVLQMFPAFMNAIAIYMVLLQLGMHNKHITIILIYVSSTIPFGTWLVKGYLDSIPNCITEAARIEGANAWTIFRKIIMPMSVPILTFCAITNFSIPWADYIYASLILRTPEKMTVSILFYKMVVDKMSTRSGLFAAGAVLIAVPIAMLYMLLQKYLVQGLTQGSSKM